MFIEFEETPNPNTLKFLPGRTVLERGTRDYKSQDDAKASPLALRLFAVDGVDGVFLSGDFVSVTRAEGTDWHDLKPVILTELMEHFSSGAPVLEEAEEASSGAAVLSSEIERQIVELLEARVKPAVAMDGGNIEFVDFDTDEGVVYLRMEGACAGCPSSTMTLKHGIETMLQHYVPEVQRVEAVDY